MGVLRRMVLVLDDTTAADSATGVLASNGEEEVSGRALRTTFRIASRKDGIICRAYLSTSVTVCVAYGVAVSAVQGTKNEVLSDKMGATGKTHSGLAMHSSNHNRVALLIT